MILGFRGRRPGHVGNRFTGKCLPLRNWRTAYDATGTTRKAKTNLGMCLEIRQLAAMSLSYAMQMADTS